MIDKWFNNDIDRIYKSNDVAVLIDESSEANFLINTIAEGIIILQTSNEIEELKAKYEIEKNHGNGKKYLIYTSTARAQLKFVREYCETNGCLEIKYLDNYVKKKVAENLNLNLNIPKEELVSAAKVSIGKESTYWMDLSHKGASEIFDLERELLPFLDNPKTYLKKYDKETQEIFFKKINDLLDQEYIDKPAQTLANEVVNNLLLGLLTNKPNELLFNVYKAWLDSVSFKKSFLNYRDKFKLPKKLKIFEVHPSHPFEKIDLEWLKEIGANYKDEQFISRVLPKINQRKADKCAKSLNIIFWADVKVLLEFDPKDINQINSFKEAVSFYAKHFYKVDMAIRKLYSLFLTQKDLIEPFQELYKSLSAVFLDKWFKFIKDYTSNQTGALSRILEKEERGIAIVVGDGVSWEFAQDILNYSEINADLESEVMLAGLPSETEHNMSQLYVKSGIVLPTKKDRERFLVSNHQEWDLVFTDLDKVNESTSVVDCLICSCKDPDKLGETYQQGALKHFNSIAHLYSEKIEQLLKNGFNTVYLVTDHGYTLSGVLESSDKIEVNFNGVVKKNERYIRTQTSQQIDDSLLIEREIEYQDYNFCYFSKRLGPFKTPGMYGFSHGGLTPQETLIPFFKWTVGRSHIDALAVEISNKPELKNVTGDLFSIKIKGNSKSNNLFSTERKVILLFFAGGTKFNESDILTIEKSKEIKKEYQFSKHKSVDVLLIDASTKEQLDKITISQSSARDLGGLL
tara:strand:+ start:2150 stop:4381 length:2232 start_codon:yes stop_codon:yes gene_type:complete